MYKIQILDYGILSCTNIRNIIIHSCNKQKIYKEITTNLWQAELQNPHLFLSQVSMAYRFQEFYPI